MCFVNNVYQAREQQPALEGVHGEAMTSLMDCPACGKSVSSLADTCPTCGYPIGRRLYCIGTLLMLEDAGVQVPTLDQMHAMELTQIEEWLEWARYQGATCPSCISLNIVKVPQPSVWEA